MAQNDVVPGNGQWPTDTWQTEEWITDKVLLALPSTLPDGEYRLLVGWYDWQTGERLSVTGGEADNALTVADLNVSR